MMFFRIFQHLLPRAKAWSLTADKPLRRFFVGLANATGAPFKTFFDRVWLDLFPAYTRELAAFEEQFGLPGAGTDAQRRDRLAAAWRATGGQDPAYIQDTLQAAGFPVFVHEWWVARPPVGDGSAATPHDPRDYLRTNSAGLHVEGKGYALVNRIFPVASLIITSAGEPFMEAGEAKAESGNFDTFNLGEVNYVTPDNPALWPYFLYIGGETFGDVIELPAARRRDFEELSLQICPAHVWLGILIKWV